ncbi:MAG TPA: protein kinase [Polyangiaceae bacterium]|nr:protein kinase [Polyangiaceae bacterium]
MLTPPPPHLEGNFRVLGRLGQGGTAEVFLAAPLASQDAGELVVLKALRSNLRFEREFYEMFLNEARLAMRLEHPNVVRTHEVFEFQGLPVIVMEYLAGLSLEQLSARSPDDRQLPLDLHVWILARALEGLHYSHELTDFDGTRLNVVHRDVSPHNVFVTFDGRVKVLDFGIAKLANSRVETATGIIKGKLRYMSPEQLSGEPVDRRSDVFSLGVMMWEALAGQKMWSGMSELQVMRALTEGNVPDLRGAQPEVDGVLRALVLRALARDPADRFQTADAFRAALDGYLSSRPPIEASTLIEYLHRGFDDERRRTERLIEERMHEPEDGSRPPLSLGERDLLGATTTAGTMTASRRNRFNAPQRAALWGWLGAALLVGSFVWATYAWLHSAPDGRATGSGGVAGPPTQPPSRALEMRVTVFPQEARIELDGRPLGGSPIRWQAQFDPTTEHRLVVTAPGHVRQERALRYDNNKELVIALEREPSTARVAPSAGAGTSSAPPSQPHTQPTPTPADVSAQGRPEVSPSASVDGCDPPFTIDERGIKKFKAECVR